MNEELTLKISKGLEKGLLFLWGIVFLLFPLFFTTLTTDAFVLPKVILVTLAVLVSLLGWGIKMILDNQVRIRRTPFDVPVLLFAGALLLSSIFAVDRADSLTATVMVLFGVVSYFVIVNVARSNQSKVFLTLSLFVGGFAATLTTLLSHYRIYLFPFASSHVQNFTPFGSFFDQTLFLALLVPAGIFFLLPLLKKNTSFRTMLLGGLGIASCITFAWSVFATLTMQRPTLLPFEVGFQTAFASLSQDAGRIAQGFFFGAGYGNYTTVFTRFHQASFNTNPQLWFLSFSQSSSYVLELLATTGLVGFLAYLFLGARALFPMSKKMHNPFYFSLVAFFALSFFLPFTLTIITLFFFVLSLFALYQGALSSNDYFDVELQFVALKKGVLQFMSINDVPHKKSHPTPLFAFILLLALVVVGGFYATTYVLADYLFASGLTAANQNNGTVAYRQEAQAITVFPYRSSYYRIFSQTNIALANSLLALQANSKSSPSATVQQTAFTLIQQAITSARTATTLSPQLVFEWQNLASVYRVLIGVGQNAESFAIASSQQAIQLDPANPQEYVGLGGIYYQLGQYDNAIKEFQAAVSLKPDYANAYYNLGHAYEQKGDLQNALAQYQIVRQLVATDATNAKKMDEEIAAIQAKLGSAGTPETKPVTATGAQQPLTLPGTTTLPGQSQQVPLVSPTPRP